VASNKIENKSHWFVGSGIIASIIASFCCIGPLILTLLGVSGAAVFTKFEIIRTPMIVLVFTLFGVSGFSLYHKRKTCEPGSICADSKKFRKMIIFYWSGLVLAILGITSPQWVAWLFS
jgi:mercuric ion transport protein